MLFCKTTDVNQLTDSNYWGFGITFMICWNFYDFLQGFFNFANLWLLDGGARLV